MSSNNQARKQQRNKAHNNETVTKQTITIPRTNNIMCISQNHGGHHGRLIVPSNWQDASEQVAPKKRKLHRLTRHNYHDHRRDVCNSSIHDDDPDKARFPLKLHAILDSAKEQGREDVISWQPHGRSFKVHKQAIFMNEILPKYLDVHKFASFQRQLNLYGFQRITRGPDKGSYYHELMLRGKPFLAHQMERTRVKGTKVRPKTNPDQEPDFWSMASLDSDLPVVDDVPSRHEDMPADMKRYVPSPSPSVMDTRTPQTKLASVFPVEAVSSDVIPMETTSYSSNPVSEMNIDEKDDDQVIIFEGRPFHYLDPFLRDEKPQATLVPSHPHECQQQQQDDDEALFSMEEMDAMMERLHQPGGIWSINVNDMDEEEFGTVLENLVMHGDVSKGYVAV